jgi:hypothetical protein
LGGFLITRKASDARRRGANSLPASGRKATPQNLSLRKQGWCLDGGSRVADPIDKCIPMVHTYAYETDERYMPMRTTLNIEDTLVERASELTGIKEKTMLVKLGLEALIARESAKRLAKLGGTERKLKPIPRRRVAEQ